MQRGCITRGVRVCAAAIFVPELSRRSNPHNPDNAHFFSYKYVANTMQHSNVTWSRPGVVHSSLTSVHGSSHKACLQESMRLTDCVLRICMRALF